MKHVNKNILLDTTNYKTIERRNYFFPNEVWGFGVLELIDTTQTDGFHQDGITQSVKQELLLFESE